MSAILSGIAGAAGVAILLATVRNKAEVIGGRTIVQYGLPLKIFAVLAFVIAIGVSYAASKASPDQVLPAVLCTIGFYVGSICLMLEFFVVRIAFDAASIRVRSPWRRSRTVAWSEVVSLEYSSAMQWHVIATRSQGAIRIPDFLSGKDDLFAAVRTNTLAAAGLAGAGTEPHP